MVTKDLSLVTVLKIANQTSTIAAKKEERARDAALAMREYEAEKLAVHANTARLRALRLAKEAAQVTSEKQPRRIVFSPKSVTPSTKENATDPQPRPRKQRKTAAPRRMKAIE